MGSKTTLKRIIAKFSFLELLYTLLVLITFAITFNQLIQQGIIYRADHAETQLKVVEKQFTQTEWTKADIPYYYEYQLIENGEKSQTISVKYDSLIEEAKKYGQSQTSNFVLPRIFVYLKNDTSELVLSYHITAFFASEKLNRYLPSAEVSFVILSFIVWITGFLGLVRRCVRFLQIELDKVTRTNTAIREMNLDYPRETSPYKEIQEILDSLDTMSTELKYSLQKQWSVQKKQKEMVQSVTHDIRTPITLIKGNLELLEEEKLTETQAERFADLANGVRRLEQYIEQLKKISNLSEKPVNKSMIDKQTVAEWIQLAKDLTKNSERIFKILQQDTSQRQVEKEALTNALQNVIVNSIEHSKSNSCIFLTFEDSLQDYRIIVEDQGTGFSEEALKEARTRFFTTKNKAAPSHYGLGLTIVNKILEVNHGRLVLENVYNEGRVCGAKVTFVLAK